MEVARNAWEDDPCSHRYRELINGPGYKNWKAATNGKTYEELKKAMADASKPRVRICVEGYNTSLPEAHIKNALFNHFKPCGRIYNIEMPKDPTIETPKALVSGLVGRCAFIIIKGDGAEEKALQLNGSDVGGWTVAVRVSPEEDKQRLTPQQRAAVTKAHWDKKFMHGISVMGYRRMDSEDDLREALVKDFDSCGEITQVLIPMDAPGRFSPINCNYIYFSEEEAVDKALKRGGSLELVLQALPNVTHGRCVIPPHITELATDISRDRGVMSVEDIIERFISVSPMITD